MRRTCWASCSECGVRGTGSDAPTETNLVGQGLYFPLGLVALRSHHPGTPSFVGLTCSQLSDGLAGSHLIGSRMAGDDLGVQAGDTWKGQKASSLPCCSQDPLTKACRFWHQKAPCHARKLLSPPRGSCAISFRSCCRDVCRGRFRGRAWAALSPPASLTAGWLASWLAEALGGEVLKW